MAVLAAILPLVSRSSTLALELYRFAAAEPDTTKDLIRTAKSINNLALIVKQVGTIIKEDDRLLSAEVCSGTLVLCFRLTAYSLGYRNTRRHCRTMHGYLE